LTPKLQKIVREIERTKAKITELQALLPELERQKTELENSEIIRVVREARVAPADLKTFLQSLRVGATVPQPKSVRPEDDYEN
jgi:hypothetical protein